MQRHIGYAIVVGLLGIVPMMAPPAAARPRHVEHRHVAPRAMPGLVVDVTRLRALGQGPTADLVQAVLTDTLAGEHAPQPGTTLVVRITAISLNSMGGTGGLGGLGAGDFGGATDNDYLEGEALVVDSTGRIVDRIPQLMALPASSGGAYYLPGFDRRRVEALSRNFGLWLKRRIG